MDRVFLTHPVPDGEESLLDVEDARHLARVLRRRPGDALWVSDGNGKEALARLVRLDDQGAVVRIETWRPAQSEPPIRVVLGQAIPKGERMDWLVQKATELGVATIVPLLTARSVVRPEGKQGLNKLRRWQRIAREAARQAQRARIPDVLPPQPFGGLLDQLRCPRQESGELTATDAWRKVPGDLLTLMPYEQESRQSLPQSLTGPRRAYVVLLIGPEGGWEPGEVELAQDCGVVPVGLGPRILRAETAGLAALTMVMAAWGDLA